jgi:flagellar hook assembly protein FlgD
MDPSTFTSQLVSYSQLEQQLTTNTTLTGLGTQLTGITSLLTSLAASATSTSTATTATS